MPDDQWYSPFEQALAALAQKLSAAPDLPADRTEGQLAPSLVGQYLGEPAPRTDLRIGPTRARPLYQQFGDLLHGDLARPVNALNEAIGFDEGYGPASIFKLGAQNLSDPAQAMPGHAAAPLAGMVRAPWMAAPAVEAGASRFAESQAQTAARFATTADKLAERFPGVADAMAGSAQPVAMAAAQAGAKTISQAARTKQLAAYRATLTPEAHGAMVEEVKAAFPLTDAYSKPVQPVLPKTLVAKSADLSPETQGFINAVVQGADPKRMITTAELQAMAAGEKFKPVRVLRPPLRSNYNLKSTLPGAPLGITSKAAEQAALDNYLQLASTAIEGRNWYDKGGASMLFHAGDDPARARIVAGMHSATSPATEFGVNSGFAIKGYNQGLVGDRFSTGRFPANMGPTVEEIFSGTSDIAQNPKRGPFYEGLGRGGGFGDPNAPARPTNDIWQAEAWGYANADGTPMRKGFGPKEHAWMDRMTQAAVDRANEMALGGHTDWTLDRLQASAWFGAKQRAEGPQPYSDFATWLERNYGQGSREAIPGETTGHLAELADPTHRALLAQYGQGVFDLTHDPKGRDVISLGSGALTGPSVRGPGAFKGVVTPTGVQTQLALGTSNTPVLVGGESVLSGKPSAVHAPVNLVEQRTVDPSSEKLQQAIESAYAMLFGQDAAAGGRFFDRGQTPAIGRDALQVSLGRVPTQQEFGQVIGELAKAGLGNDVAQIFGPQGYTLKHLPGAMTPEAEEAMRQAVATVHGPGAVPVEPGAWRSIYTENDWRKPGQEFGQRYFDAIKPIREKFDQFAPALAEKANALDQQLLAASGGKFKLSENLVKLREVVRTEGYAGLERLAKEYGVSVLLLASAAGLLGYNVQQRGEETGQVVQQ